MDILTVEIDQEDGEISSYSADDRELDTLANIAIQQKCSMARIASESVLQLCVGEHVNKTLRTGLLRSVPVELAVRQLMISYLEFHKTTSDDFRRMTSVIKFQR